MERFNELALRSTQPGRRWVLKAILIGLSMKVLQIFLAVVVDIGLSLSDDGAESYGNNRLMVAIIAGMLLAPILETWILVLIHFLTRNRIGLTGFVLVNAIEAALSHISSKDWLRIDAVAAFVIMSYQYVSYREQLGSRPAFWGVALTHATSNAVAAGSLLAFMSLS